MPENLDRILATVEKIAFTAIAVYVAIFLMSFGASHDSLGYGKELLGGLTIILILAGAFLLVWVVSTSIGIVGKKNER